MVSVPSASPYPISPHKHLSQQVPKIVLVYAVNRPVGVDGAERTPGQATSKQPTITLWALSGDAANQCHLSNVAQTAPRKFVDNAAAPLFKVLRFEEVKAVRVFASWEDRITSGNET